LTARHESGFGFAPDAARAARLDAFVRNRIAESLETILDACAGRLSWQDSAWRTLLAKVRHAPIPPAIVAMYAELVEAVFQDNLPAAQVLLDGLPAATDLPVSPICTLGDGALGPGQAARYGRIMADDPDNAARHLPLSDAQMYAAGPVFTAAFGLIRRADAVLAAELDVLLRQTVLTHRLTAAGLEPALTGASSFYLWGACFINFCDPPARLAAATALVHEAAHLLLFGFGLGAPLVTNGDAARYRSPLRDDPRPMDGIVHAAFVLARMTWCLERLTAAGVLTPEEAEQAADEAARHRQDFATALAIINGHALFTDTGRSAFAGAAEWMSR
jgi:hypothetical protein